MARVITIQELNCCVVPANDHPVRREYYYGVAMAFARELGAVMVEVERKDIGPIISAMTDESKRLRAEIIRRAASRGGRNGPDNPAA